MQERTLEADSHHHNDTNNIRDIWLKAAVVGSLWGASEIVLGSFLHNLKIPFSGNLLTAIAIILMISGHRLWPERGMLIRAGLICAALKTLSPSANILGPMLAIVMQATIMETVLLAGRRSWVGYLTGGGLAMAWNLFHRILTSLVIYGGTLIELYKSLIRFFVNQTGWQTEGYLGPVLILAGIYFFSGCLSAAAGIYISKISGNKNILVKSTSPRAIDPLRDQPTDTVRGKWIIMRIAGILIMLVLGMYSINRLPLYVSVILLTFFLSGIWLYDSKLIRRFGNKRSFWISMAIMLVLSGFLLGKDEGDSGISTAGIKAGVEMMMRAMYIITGFGIISKELRRQNLLQWFKSRHMEAFLDAVRISFQTTPMLIEAIPGKHAWKNPVSVLSSMIASMEYSLEYVKRHTTSEVFIITGQKGSGKTTLLMEVVKQLKGNGIGVSGIMAPELIENGERAGYYVQNILTGQQRVLCRKSEQVSDERPGLYVFDYDAVKFGEEALLSEAGNHGTKNIEDTQLVVVDELGPYELKGQGWSTAMDSLYESTPPAMLWVVRESLINAMLERWPATTQRVYYAGQSSVNEITGDIISMLKR